MDRRCSLGFLATYVTIVAGCGQSSSPTAATAAAPADPAAQVASEFLDAAIQGDTQRAVQLYTPVAFERMKQFQMPGITDYTYKITGVGHPSDGRALVECKATRTSTDGQTADEDICLLLARVQSQWRVSGMAFSSDPKSPPMIFNFERPERGPVPLEQWMAETQASDAGTASRPSPPRTAQEVVPAGAYR
jgi:hypothetical protein